MIDLAAVFARVRGAERRSASALRQIAWVLFAAGMLFAIAGHLLGDTFYLRLGSEALIFAGMAISVDLLVGISGLLSLGQALFFGLGAYASALLLIHVSQSFWLVMICVVLGSIPVSALLGWIAIRSRGVYFALITFGYAQVISRIVYNTRELGASDGIIGVPVIAVDLMVARLPVDQPAMFFGFLVVMVAGLLFGLWWLLDTPFGRVFSAIRVNEHRLGFIGYHARGYMLTMYVLAAVVASVFGALYPMLRGFVSPELMYFEMSGNALIMVILGGVGTLVGPVIGAVALTVLKSVVGSFTEHHAIIIGGLFVILVLFFPKGIVGYLHPRLQARLARRGADENGRD